MTGYRDGYDFRKWSAASMKQRRRRYWVRWVLAGSTMAALGATMLTKGDHPPIFLIFLPGIFASHSPFAREGWATGRGRGVYDEFEHTAILTATARAFAAFLGLVTLLLGWLAIAPKWDWPTPQSSGEWIGWLLTMLIVGTSLPATFAEFMVPMPEPEDDTL